MNIIAVLVFLPRWPCKFFWIKGLSFESTLTISINILRKINWQAGSKRRARNARPRIIKIRIKFRIKKNRE